MKRPTDNVRVTSEGSRRTPRARSGYTLQEISRVVTFMVTAIGTLFAISVLMQAFWHYLILPAAAVVIAGALWSGRLLPRFDRGRTSAWGPLRRAQRRRLRGLARSERRLAVVVVCICLFLRVDEGDPNGSIIVTLFLVVFLCGFFHFFARACAAKYGAAHPVGESRTAVLAGGVAFVLSLAAIGSTGWALGAKKWGFPAPGDLVEALQGNRNESADPRRSNTHPEAYSPRDSAEGHAEGPPTPAPPEALIPHDVEDSAACRLRTRIALLRTAPVPVAGRAMWTEWWPFGSGVVGCVERLEQKEGLLIATLRGGQSDPALIISDRLGRAAVVFEELVPLARRLLRRDLVYVGKRISNGYGDYQVFYLTGSKCVLAGRLHDSEYVALPPTATVLVEHQGAARRKFPSLVTAQSVSGRREFVVRFQGEGEDEIETVVVGPNGKAWLEAAPEETIRPDAVCPDMSRLQSLADALYQRFVREHPDAVGGHSSVGNRLLAA